MDPRVDLIIARLNAWRAELIYNIVDAPPFTDDLNGPVQNLPPLEGEDLELIREQADQLLNDKWPVVLVEKFLKQIENVCPFWTEEHAIRKMQMIKQKAIEQGARE